MSNLTAHLFDVVGRYPTVKTLQAEIAEWLCADESFDEFQEPAGSKNLAVFRLLAKARGKIGNGTDGRIVIASFETDHPQCGIAGRNADAYAEIDAPLAPLRL